MSSVSLCAGPSGCTPHRRPANLLSPTGSAHPMHTPPPASRSSFRPLWYLHRSPESGRFRDSGKADRSRIMSRRGLDPENFVRGSLTAVVALPPSLRISFDASVQYAPDNATPVSGAIGFVIREGDEVVREVSRPVDAFVSNVALEYRALVAASRVVAARPGRIASVHVRGDADVVIRTVDPDHPATPSGSLVRRRVDRIRGNFADVPDVSYRAVNGDQNRSAHRLARAGHSE